MTDINDVVQAWRKLIDNKQDRDIIRNALSGDGSSAPNSDVNGRSGMAWVRFDDKQDHASQVINWFMPGLPQGVPVIVGKQHPTDRFYQILGINLEMYYQGMDYGQFVRFILPRHGDSHTAGTGNDPAWIDTRNLIFGRARETSPQSLSLHVETLTYEWLGNPTRWPGGTVDLTAYIPADTGRHKYVVIYIDPDTNALGVLDGVGVPTPVSATIPDIDIVCVPIAVVALAYGDTVITEQDIYDARILVNVLGQALFSANHAAAVVEAEMDLLISKHIAGG